MAVNFTESAITKAAREVRETGKQRNVHDAACRGLMIRLTKGGSKTFNLSCRDTSGAPRMFPLGQFPDMSISDARNAARALHAQIKAGGPDPAVEKAKLRAIRKDAKDGVGTLRALIDIYEKKEGSKLKSWPRQRQAIENVFKKHLDRAVATMTPPDLQMTADGHKAEFSAALAVRCIRPVLKWASVSSRGFAPAVLTEIHPPATVQARKRRVSYDELGKLLPALTSAPGAHAAAMRFMLLTLARREEVCSARWRDVDLATGTWTILETKNGEPHTVPLPRQALDLLRARLPAGSDGKPREPERGALVFATSTGGHLSNWDRATKAILVDVGLADAPAPSKGQRKSAGVTMKDGSAMPTRHDLRRTAATLLGEMGIDPHVIEASLNHINIHSRLAVNYNQSRYRPQVAAALQMLADRLDSIEAGNAENAPPVPSRAIAEAVEP
jgi:integrase